MHKYELTIVINGEASAAKKKGVQASVEKLVKTGKGKVVKKDDWGKKDLAYQINKSDTGIFIYYDLELDGQQASILPRELNLNEDIIRYLLVRGEK